MSLEMLGQTFKGFFTAGLHRDISFWIHNVGKDFPKCIGQDDVPMNRV